MILWYQYWYMVLLVVSCKFCHDKEGFFSYFLISLINSGVILFTTTGFGELEHIAPWWLNLKDTYVNWWYVVLLLPVPGTRYYTATVPGGTCRRIILLLYQVPELRLGFICLQGVFTPCNSRGYLPTVPNFLLLHHHNIILLLHHNDTHLHIYNSTT